MPRKRRLSKLRRRMALHANDLSISELLDFISGPRLPFGGRAFVRWTSWDEYEEVWEAVKAELTPTEAEPRPHGLHFRAGERPAAWWRYDAPGPRFIIGRRPVYRWPGGFTRGEQTGWENVQEPAPAALARFGQLFDWERARLRPEDFRPPDPAEVVFLEVPREPDAEDDGDDDPDDDGKEAHDDDD